jgi:uncharacterized delta-60 repeat protein
MRRWAAVFVLVSAMLGVSLSGAQQVVSAVTAEDARPHGGPVDLSFGNGGMVKGSRRVEGFSPIAMATATDGGVVMTGYAPVGIGSELGVLKWTADGALDQSFGTNGLATEAFGFGYNAGTAIAALPDGNVIAGGIIYGTAGLPRPFGIARFLSNGTLDPTFGAGGKVTTLVPAINGVGVASIRVQPDGRIVVVGMADNNVAVPALVSTPNQLVLARYDQFGVLDPTFGTSGIVVTTANSSVDSVSAAVVTADGGIVVAGRGSTSAFDLGIAVWRFRSDGSLDTTFGTAGRTIVAPVALPASGGYPWAQSMVVDPNGNLVIGGYRGQDDFGISPLLIVRLRPNGSLDTTFGTGGVTTTKVGKMASYAFALAVQPDGKIVAAGTTADETGQRVLLARYLPNGTLDPWIGRGGVVETTVGQNSAAMGVSVRSDGKVTLGGWFQAETAPGSQTSTSYPTLLRYDLTDRALSTIPAKRVFDTRSGKAPSANQVTVVRTGAPSGAKAALVNVTTTGAVSAGFVSAGDCIESAELGFPAAPSVDQSQSSANFQPGADAANLAVVNVDGDGAFCISASAMTHLIVDVQGFYGSTGLKLTGRAPTRTFDSRSGARLPAGAITKVSSGAPSGTAAVMVNLTATDALLPGYVTAGACGVLKPGPQTASNANFRAAQDASNTAVVAVDTRGEFCIYNSAPVHLVVDVQADFNAATGRSLSPTDPLRYLDTRNGTRPTEGQIVKVTTAPQGRSAVLVNLTMTGATAAGYITADKCSALKPGPQAKSNGNFRPDQDVANIALVNLDSDGSFCIVASAPVHVLADIIGAY